MGQMILSPGTRSILKQTFIMPLAWRMLFPKFPPQYHPSKTKVIGSERTKPTDEYVTHPWSGQVVLNEGLSDGGSSSGGLCIFVVGVFYSFKVELRSLVPINLLTWQIFLLVRSLADFTISLNYWHLTKLLARDTPALGALCFKLRAPHTRSRTPSLPTEVRTMNRRVGIIKVPSMHM